MDRALPGSLVQRHGCTSHSLVCSGIAILNEHAGPLNGSAGSTAIPSITVAAALVLAHTLGG